jgi:hypothetical protein
MRRREFISLIGAATVAWPFDALAQQSGQMRRIGVLNASRENDPESERSLRAILMSHFHDLELVIVHFGDDLGLPLLVE